MENSIEILRHYIQAVQPLPDEVWEAFSQIWQPVEYKRKTVLTAAGETERHLYFVLEGVQRAFHVDDHHPDATIVFTYPHSFSGVADSFLTQMPSRFFFETLTSSKLLRTSYQQVKALADKHPELMAWVMKATAFALAGVLERQVELLKFSAEEKFRILLKRSPHVLQMIPHKYLASYLGIDASTFSKLLSSVRIE
ncbi:MAG: Crp/Fnr family transcriptional regulator [Pseudobacter sp.]|uniref:Crp/Fnr family transcriptional regulator n=1 Tax=Pseudobacter sp. TaxID=2045420 RepID=UPI003F7F85C5